MLDGLVFIENEKKEKEKEKEKKGSVGVMMYKRMPLAVTILIGLVLLVLVEHGVEFFYRIEGGDLWGIAKAVFTSLMLESIGAVGLYIGFNRLTKKWRTRLVFLLGSLVCLSVSFFIQWSYFRGKVDFDWAYGLVMPLVVAISSAGVSLVESEVAEQSSTEQAAVENANALLKTKEELERVKIENASETSNLRIEIARLQSANSNLGESLGNTANQAGQELERVRSENSLLLQQLSGTREQLGHLEHEISNGQYIHISQFQYQVTELKEQLENASGQLQHKEREVAQLQAREQKLLSSGVQQQIQAEVNSTVVEGVLAQLDRGEISVEEAVIRSNGQVKAATASTRLSRGSKRRMQTQAIPVGASVSG